MAFSVNALTSAGNDLIAQATSANPIVYIGSVASTFSFTALELASMDDPQGQAWTETGIIVASSATGNTARIIAGFTNKVSSATIKTVGILGRLASQSDSQAIVVAAVSDDNASIRIPSTSEPPVRIEVALNITISDTASVTVTSSTAGSAMLSDLDRLVSCHKAGQATTGENQTIYGEKTFFNDLTVGDEYGCTMTLHSEEQSHYGYSDISVENNETGNTARLIFNVDGVNRIECEGDFLPYDNEEYNFGSSTYKWDNVFTRQVQCDSVIAGAIVPNGGLSIGSENNFADTFHVNRVVIDTEEIRGILNIHANGMNGEAYIEGSDDLSIYTDSGNLSLGGNSSVSISSAGTVSISGNGVNINTSLSATSFSGLLPRPASAGALPPVGGIFMISIARRDTSVLPASENLTIGDSISFVYQSSTYKAAVANHYNGSYQTSGLTEISANFTATLLSRGSNTTGWATFLVMRTA